MLVKNAKVFYLDDGKSVKPSFKKRPVMHVTPINPDVDLITVDFSERWALIGGGSDNNNSELLIFSESCESGKTLFEVHIEFRTPCRIYGSRDKASWHGVVLKAKAEDRKDHYWKDMQIAKITPRKRFDKKPFTHYRTR